MSNLRQLDEGVLARSYGVSFSITTHRPPSSETWDQLVYATKGVLTVTSSVGIWIVPPHRAVWLPANTTYTLSMTGLTALRMIYLPVASRPVDSPFDRSSCSVVNVSPLLRELVVRTAQIGALESRVEAHCHIAGLIQSELNSIQTIPIQLPSPSSDLAVRFAALFEEDSRDALAQCGTSRRTMERLFTAETGMSLGQWVRRRKLLLSLQRILDGATIASVAFDLGYSSPSAFIAMFKRELGSSPTRYLSPNSSRI